MVITVNQTNFFQYGYLFNMTATLQLYWERKTGIMLDMHSEEDTSRPDGAGGVLIAHFQGRILLLSAVPSPPVIPEFPTFLILPLFMVAALLAVIVYKRKRSKDT